MAENCALCERTKEQESEFCDLHNSAKLNIDQAYTAWISALGGNLTFRDYLERIMKLGETGKFARDVASQLLNSKA